MNFLTGSPDMTAREDFGSLLNSRGLLGTIVEVGVYRGGFARDLLSRWTGLHYIGVDPWQNGLAGYVDVIADREKDMQAVYEAAAAKLAEFAPRVSLLRMFSLEAARLFADASLDFVYIDANHHRPFVEDDIAAWWPKVKPGGIFGGHDINGDWEPEVAPAVRAFLERENLKGYFVLGDAASWYVEKPL